VRCHRVSLLPISYTHDAKRIPSPTIGTRSTLAPQISDCGWLMHRLNRTSEPNSSHHERPRSTRTANPTAGNAHSLRARGSWRQYFEGCPTAGAHESSFFLIFYTNVNKSGLYGTASADFRQPGLTQYPKFSVICGVRDILVSQSLWFLHQFFCRETSRLCYEHY
jgi:hypothetical protein